MDLIYGEFVNGNIEDINVLLDYSYDAVIGIGDKDVNDFECRVQAYNHKCAMDNVLYVEFTEYGGIIDRIESDRKTGEIIYKGRTWRGILNSYVVCKRKAYDGEINDIIAAIIHDIGMESLFVVDAIPQDERGIKVNYFEVAYEKAYDAIIRLLQRKDVNGKLICYYFDGKVHLGAVLGVDYSCDEEFDTSRIPYKVGRTDNTVNHLICLGQGDGANRAVIHLFTDDIQQDINHKYHVQPYTLVPHPAEDAEYILDMRNKKMFGKDERCAIYDAPNSEIVTNYKRFNSAPYDWSSQYFNKYYEDSEPDEGTGEIKKQKIKEVRRDIYTRQTAPPSDWNTNYGDYYYFDKDKDGTEYIKLNGWDKVAKARETDKKYFRGYVNTGANDGKGAFTNVKERPTSDLTEYNGGISWEEVTTVTPPDDWETKYRDYYTDSGSTGKAAVSGYSYDTYGAGDTYTGRAPYTAHTGAALTQPPPDWNKFYANYYTRNKNILNQWVYTAIEGIHHEHFEQVQAKNAPADWATTWGNYYVKITKDDIKTHKLGKDKYIKNKKAYYVTASEAIIIKKLSYISDKKKYPKYDKKKFWVKITDADTAPPFSDFYDGAETRRGYGVYEKFSFTIAPLWDYPNTHYYKKILNQVPIFGEYTGDKKGVYKKEEDKRLVPDFSLRPYYYAVQDRLAKLVEKGLEELKRLNDLDTLEMSLELDNNYDILDTVGMSDDVTGITVYKPILRKIIKIKKDLLTVEYEVE